MPLLASSADALGIHPAAVAALVGAGFVFAALKMIAADIDYARRCHALRQQVAALREQQAERLRNLRPRRR